jgi:hypothetical protein
MINVVMLSRTALAGAPYENAKCINKYSKKVRVRWVALRTTYADGRKFPQDMLYSDPEAKKLIGRADIIHLHNETFPGLESYRKKLLIQFHSCPIRQTFKLLRDLTPHVYTIDQPMQQREYRLPGLPNMIDPEEYRPKTSFGPRLKIVFAPTNNWNMNMIGSKASVEVERTLKQATPYADVDIFSSLDYVENLERKKYADILIDDLIGKTFHRTALEGCCFGLAVLTSTDHGGWINTNLMGLIPTLRRLVGERDYLNAWKKKSREWLLKEWHPATLVKAYEDAYQKILGGY